MISYFPTAGGLKSLTKKGDVVCLGIGILGSSSYYSNNHVTSMGSVINAGLLQGCTYVYLPECIYVDGFKSNTILEEVSIPKCISISAQAFSGCSQLKKVNAPLCTTIGRHAFYYCTNLQSLNFPECTYISAGGFSSAVLSSFNFPKLTTLYSYAFCRASFNFNTNITNSIISSISDYAFSQLHYSGTINLTAQEISLGLGVFDAAEITSLNIPNLSICPSSLCLGCTNLTTVNLPQVTTVYSAAFAGCTQLQSITLTNCSLIYGTSTSASYSGGPFINCTELTTISLPNLQRLSGYNFFNGCVKLQSIYLMGSTVCSITSSLAFRSCPITVSSYLGYFGSIYVPASLLTDYQTATYWKNISARIVGI